jgi:hypothetical protein
VKSYSKIRHIKSSNLILENRFLNEGPEKLTGLAKRLGEITGISEELFKYFDTKDVKDLNPFKQFVGEMGKKVRDLDQDKVKKITQELDYFSVLYNLNSYEKDLIKFIKDTITDQAKGFEHIKKNPYLSPDENVNKTLTTSDNDFEYKKESDMYFFKLKESPKSPRAQKLKRQGKYVKWTLAKGNAKTSIEKLFKS